MSATTGIRDLSHGGRSADLFDPRGYAYLMTVPGVPVTHKVRHADQLG
jgi:hypothetical protein